MKNYTAIRTLLKDFKSGDLQSVPEFFFKGVYCFWGNDERDYLRCDPSTDRQYYEFYKLQAELEYRFQLQVSLS